MLVTSKKPQNHPPLPPYKKTKKQEELIIQFTQLKDMMKKLGASEEYKKGLWTVEEDRILMDYIQLHGKGKWNRIPLSTGLKRCGKSCRLRWVNYLSPNVKRGDFSQEEDDLIIRLHNLLGNRWSLIAGRVPGRTDNQVKNHWNTHLSKKLGFNPTRRLPTLRRPNPTHLPLPSCPDSSCDKRTTVDDMWGKSNMPSPSPRGALVTENGRSRSLCFFDDELNLRCAPNVVDSSGEFTLDFLLYGGT